MCSEPGLYYLQTVATADPSTFGPVSDMTVRSSQVLQPYDINTNTKTNTIHTFVLLLHIKIIRKFVYCATQYFLFLFYIVHIVLDDLIRIWCS